MSASYVVAGRVGARVREGPALDSEKVMDLPVGTSVVVVEMRDHTTGKYTTTRARLASPCVGWCSLKTLSPKDHAAQDGPPMEEDVVSAALLAYALLEAEASETPATKSAEGEDDERDGLVLV